MSLESEIIQFFKAVALKKKRIESLVGCSSRGERKESIVELADQIERYCFLNMNFL